MPVSGIDATMPIEMDVHQYGLEKLRERLEAAEAICRLVPAAAIPGGWRFPNAPAEYARWRPLAHERPSIPDTPEGRAIGRRLALAERLIECIDLVESSDSEGELKEAGRWVLTALAAWLDEGPH